MTASTFRWIGRGLPLFVSAAPARAGDAFWRWQMRYVRTVLVRVLLLALASVIAAGDARAQSGTATLFGHITDPQGAGIPGATIPHADGDERHPHAGDG
jgi:hypothetical protein